MRIWPIFSAKGPPRSGNLLASLLHGGLAAEANASLGIDVDDLDEDLVTLVDLVLHLPDPLIGDFRDVDETLYTRKDLDEGPEVHDSDDLADVDLPELRLGGELADDLHGLLGGRLVNGRNIHPPVVVDVDLRACALNDRADRLSARPDDFADLVLGNPDGDDARSEGGDFPARRGQRLLHHVQDEHTSGAGLLERLLHDGARDSRDLDVHLQRRDPRAGAGDL